MSKKLTSISFILIFTIFNLIANEHPQEKPILGQDILLIINYNHLHYESIDFLKNFYSPYFPHIVIYGPSLDEIDFCDHDTALFSYKTIAHAMHKYPGYAGYLFIHDDVMMNPKNFDI